MGLRTMSYYDYERRGLYRSRHGVIAGVCAGIAEYFDLSVFWTRVVAVGIFLVSGIWPAVILYIIAALMMKKDPYVRY